jgi:leucyl/phenylalanyl-tRNA---protein transferase
MYFLDEKMFFPPVTSASPEGILAVGGDLSVNRLLLAYKNGIFPWYDNSEPKLWWCPPVRMVLFFENLHISKTMRLLMQKNTFTVTFNTAFEMVIRNCQKTARKGQEGTWINEEMISAYLELHKAGHAKSVEVWQNGILVGGLYGVDLGHIFCGESMFSKVSNASKVAFIYLATHLQEKNYKLLDCQVYNDHLASLGCEEILRSEFLEILHQKY